MKKYIVSNLVVWFAMVLGVYAQGDLLVTPTRVMFDDNKQKEELNLVNIGNDTAVYSISFVNYNMKVDGSFLNITQPDSGQMFADEYLRVFPRKVTLAPREPQVIVLQRKRGNEMATGEYRSHLYFRSDKNNKPLGMERTLKDTGKLGVQLIPVFGLSIPVIIRNGEVAVSSKLSDLSLEIRKDSLQYLKITINRTGNISTYGDIIIQYKPIQGEIRDIGLVKGVGVYTNITKRIIAVKLKNAPGMILQNGVLKVRYIGEKSSKRFIYDEQEMVIQ